MRIQDDFKNLCDWVAIKKKKKKTSSKPLEVNCCCLHFLESSKNYRPSSTPQGIDNKKCVL